MVKLSVSVVLVSGKYIALQICDDEDIETMLESFKQQDQMSVLELYIEKMRHLVLFIERNLEEKVVYLINFMYSQWSIMVSFYLIKKYYCRFF